MVIETPMGVSSQSRERDGNPAEDSSTDHEESSMGVFNIPSEYPLSDDNNHVTIHFIQFIVLHFFLVCVRRSFKHVKKVWKED